MSRYIVFALLAVALLAGCGKKARLISRSKLEDIYTDMYLADQWLLLHPEQMREADSLLVYVPILKQYGYTLEDYRYSVDHYSLDPERFAKILTKVSENLHNRSISLENKAKSDDSWAELLRKMDNVKPVYQIYDSLFVGILDTYKVDLQMDSMSRYVARKVLPLWVPSGPGITRRDRWLKMQEAADSTLATDAKEEEDAVANVNVPKMAPGFLGGMVQEQFEIEEEVAL